MVSLSRVVVMEGREFLSVKETPTAYLFVSQFSMLPCVIEADSPVERTLIRQRRTLAGAQNEYIQFG